MATFVSLRCGALAALVWLVCGAEVGAQPVKAPATAASAVELHKTVTGKDATALSSFLVDHGVASVTAASLAGVGVSALTAVEDTKDLAVMLSPFQKDGKGGGFSIAPARVRNPLPKIDLMTDYVQSGWWRALAGLTISGAQGTSEIGKTSFKRRAFSISTSAYFRKHDDPIYQRATEALPPPGQEAPANTCYGAYAAAMPLTTGTDTEGLGGEPVTGPAATKALADYKACINKVYALARSKWFLPRWTLAYGTGDAQPSAGGSAARTGDTFMLAATYGRAWQEQAPDAKDAKAAAATEGKAVALSGWAVSVLARHTRDGVVLKSLETGPVQRQDLTLLAARLAVGTESWRMLAEASNNRLKQTNAGESTLQQALGIDYRVGKDSWFNVRYGKRLKSTGDGKEAAALMSLTLGGELLNF